MLRKRGKVWHFRGSIPVRQADGTIRRQRHEESTHAVSLARAREIAADIERYYHDLAYKPAVKRGPTFAEAAITYIQTRGRSDRFVTKLIKFFGETPLADIDQAAAARAADALYPGASASSRARAIFTPLIAIGTLADRSGATVPKLTRPHASSEPVGIPTDNWFDAILPICPDNLAALITFLTLTGRRAGEAIALTERDVDYERKIVSIARTKTGVPVTCSLPDFCLFLLRGDSGIRRQEHGRLFGYNSVTSAWKALSRACKRAGVKRYGFHALGRHSFATRALRAGKSLEWVRQAGGWASIKMVSQHYAHLEQQDIDDQVRDMGQEWGRRFEERQKAAKNG